MGVATKIIAIGLLLASSACADRAQHVNDWYQQAKAECLKQPLTRDTAIQEETCVSDALLAANKALESQTIGAASQRANSVHSAAVAYASGEISREEFISEYRAADASYNQAVIMEQERQNQQSQQQIQTLLYINQALSPQPVGGGINCYTYNTGPVAQTNCY